MNQTIHKCRAVVAGLVLLVACGLPGLVAAQTAQKEDVPEGRSRAASGAAKPCIECHESSYAIARTKHGVKSDSRTPEAKGKSITGDPADAMCGSCHGDLTAHNQTPRVKGLVPIVFGKKAPAEPQNEACLSCHQSAARIAWQGSKHERSKQSCASCHRVHAPKDPVTVAETQAAICFECHKDRRAEMYRMSTHPLKTGFLTCSSCHAAHGSSSSRGSLIKDTVNETCYTCHAKMRGPFLWEHRSAQDDCGNCHNPHGSNNPPMLKVRMPYLCQQCHQDSGHPNGVYSGNQLEPAGVGTASRLVANSCANCHMKVHGSNHPSGARLQR
ncbi:MAG: DmsE family decaheme c-type cytochrome [Sulfuritalea sp.]|nr:DmsE family decaheme c-type cytochrome [Sulfuritalea sp.]